MADVAHIENPKEHLIRKHKSLDEELSRSVDNQVDLINEQIQIEHALTKAELAEQKESIARLKADLADDCNLIGVKILRHVLSENTIPKSAFRGAKMVLLMQAAFAAAGMTALRGEGFVVALYNGKWSAPAFIRLSSLGLGFALGGEMVDTIAILYRDEDVEKYKKGDFGTHAYMTGSPLEAEHSMNTEAHPVVYTAKSGTLLNFSLNGGGMSHNMPANAKKYGAHVTPEDILNGTVDVPSDMADFYRELSSLTEKST